MSKIISVLNTTPDGFCGHSTVIADEEHHQFANDLLNNADKVIFGRITYQLFESYWPIVLKENIQPKSILDFAKFIDNIDKIVISKTLNNVQWNNSTILKEISKDNILAEKQKSKKNIMIAGSPSIVAEFTKLGLIDEYYFSIQPIIAGNGKRLFETIKLDNQHNLKLVDIKTFKSGVVTLCYKKAN